MGEKNKKVLTGLSVVVLTIVVIGATYALFQFSRNGQRTNQVSTASVTMTYTEEQNGLTLSNAMPTTDEVGKMISDSDKVFDFTVSITVTGGQNISYEVTAEKVNSSTLQDSDVKLYLVRGTDGTNYNDEVLLPSNYNPMSSSDSFGASAGEMVLDSGVVNSSTTYYYKLRMWVDENYQIDNTVRSYTVKVNVYGRDGEVTSSNKVDVRSVKRKTITTDDTIDLDIPNASGATSWTSSNPNIATVDSDGVVEPVSTGTTTVTGSNGGNTRSITIIITPAPITGNSLAAHIKRLYNNGDTDLITDSDGNIRYSGVNPKNYINFNGETWRIIGVFGNNVKIMRDASIGYISWDALGSNDWTRPATLRTILNGNYYNGNFDLSGATSGDTSGETSFESSFETSSETSGETSGEVTQTDGLANSARLMVQSHTWNIGTFDINENLTASMIYVAEKSSTDTANVGLPTVSDYYYTSSSCLDKEIYNNQFYSSEYDDWLRCSATSWMYNVMTNNGQHHAWFLTKYYRDEDSLVYSLTNYELIGYADGDPRWRGHIYPVVYLKSDVILADSTRTGASGSKYTISS